MESLGRTEAASVENRQVTFSAIVITGDDSFYSSPFFAAIKDQTISDRIELLVMRYEGSNPTGVPSDLEQQLEVREIRLETGNSLGDARMEGVCRARGQVAAIIEDHCIPDPFWAESLLAAHSEPGLVVGYVFSNGSPESYCYKSFFFAEYGRWMYPFRGGAVDTLPNNNIAYNRGDILSVVEKADFNLKKLLNSPEQLRLYGFDLVMEPGARVWHQAYRKYRDTFYSHFLYSRILGGTRITEGNWGMVRRGVYACAVPLVVPALQIVRIHKVIRKLKGRYLFGFLTKLPLIYCFFQFAAIGEMFGYLIGKGDAEHALDNLELNGARIGQIRQ